MSLYINFRKLTYKKLKYWFDKELAQLLAHKIISVKSNFNTSLFINTIDKGVESLELKDRIAFISDELHKNLGVNFVNNIKILLAILGPENKEDTGMFKIYYWIMPIATYVEKYGLDDFEVSIKAIKEITKRNTGEYAIRPFINKYPEKTLKILLTWTKDKNKHVRRLTSEGVRPRLPWATKLQRFIDAPQPLLPILTMLKDDSSKYVQKSVANCLNDILKDNAELGKLIIIDWSVNSSKQRKWIIKHALRNLIKKDDAWAKSIISNL